MNRRFSRGPRSYRADSANERRLIVLATVGVVALAVCVYAAYVKQWPFSSQFTMRGQFTSANQLKSGNPVRIAGDTIGKVTGVEVEPGGHALVTMSIDQPSELRADASLSILPRVIFEGNFYVDVNPGTPDASPMRSGTTVPLARTSVPVQIDQVLDVLTEPVRQSLTSSIGQLSDALGAPQGAPSSNSGYAGLQRSTQQLDAAAGSIGAVATAARGTRAGDLTRSIEWFGNTSGQFARHPAALADLVRSYRQTFSALAAQQDALSASVVSIDHLTSVGRDDFTRIDRALPSLTRLASALRPALRTIPSTLPAASALLSQIHTLSRPTALPAAVAALGSLTSALPTLEHRLGALSPYVTSASRCVSDTVVPALDMTVPDGTLNDNAPAWLDFVHMAANLAGVAASFDGNGTTFRAGVTEGPSALTTFSPTLGDLVGTGSIQGLDPESLGYNVDPPFRPDVPCTSQALPDLSVGRLNQTPSTFATVAAHPDPAAAKLLAEITGSTRSRTSVLRSALAALGPVSHTTPSRYPSASGRALSPAGRPAGAAGPAGPSSSGSSSSLGAPAKPSPPQKPSSPPQTGTTGSGGSEGVSQIVTHLLDSLLGKQQP